MNNSRRRFRPRQKNNFRRRSNGVVHSNGHFQSNSGNNNFSRNGSMSNPFNIEKAIQKYKQLAKDALSSGDPILSENYLQHADHFTRILNEKESHRREKFSENNSENISDITEDNIDSSDQSSEKDLVETSNDNNKTQKIAKPQSEIS